MSEVAFRLTRIKRSHTNQIRAFITRHWGSEFCVSRGKVHNVTELPGYIYLKKGEIAGLVTFCITGRECEIVTLNSTIENRGLGSALVRKVLEDAKAGQVHRVWLITTNDNLKAIRFYQKLGFEWAAFHRNAVLRSRELKPQIPEFGIGGIRILHELEFEYILRQP